MSILGSENFEILCLYSDFGLVTHSSLCAKCQLEILYKLSVFGLKDKPLCLCNT